MNLSTNTSDQVILSTESSTFQRENIVLPAVRIVVRRKDDKTLQSAVYAYIQAVRALGRNQLNTIEIAEALSIPVTEVNRAIVSLKKKGVKVLNG